MSKKIISGGILLLGAFLTFLSCESLFTTNIFATMDELDISDMSTEEQAVALLDDTDSALDSLTDEEVDELLDDLEDLYTDTSEDDATRQQAAAAAAEVELAQSGADDTINNLSDLANDLVSDELTVDDPGDILTAIFSDENGDPLTEAEISEQLDAMLEAVVALEAYGDVLGDDGDAPVGVDSTELAVTAMVVGLVDYMVDSGNSTTDIATAIAAEDTSTLTLPSLDDMTADNGMETLFGEDLANTIEGSDLVSTLLDQM
ncbi:MAG: hypothetical protein PQJ60_10360 [Spirochaetales bacterium]|nr:hypothetical protein [Spirochaetales bacterium]